VSVVSLHWLPFVICLVTMLSFLGVWLLQWLPRYRLLSHKKFTVYGIDVYVMDGAGVVLDQTFRDEVMVAARVVCMLTGADYLAVLGYWQTMAVFFVPDIDDRFYPSVPYKTITGLSWETRFLVQLLPGQELPSSALKHELCHIRQVQDVCGSQTDIAIETCLRKVGA
jgi:hypothetical protein